jgi:hypothetical protein
MNDFAEPGELQDIGGQPDMVNRPPHYTGGEIECIDAIREAVKDLQGEEAYCTAAAIKYLWRWKRKNGVEDLEKCVWYVKRIISHTKG